MGDSETTIHVRAALRGDERSLGWVYSRFSPFLVAEARYRLSRGGLVEYDAEDLVHDVWIICAPKLQEVAPRDGRYTPSLLRFLSATLLNHHRNLLVRNLRRQRNREDAIRVRTLPTNSDLSYVVTASMQGDVARRISQAIEALPASFHEVVVLRGVEGLPYSILAQRLETAEGVLKVRYHRALGKLRAVLPEAFADELED